MKTDMLHQARRLPDRFRRHGWHGNGHPLRRDHALGIGIGIGAAVAGTAYAAYRFGIQPWHRHWGATPEEQNRVLPGDDLVQNARYRTTRAITIDAPVEDVWPWLVQLGQNRGGFYSYSGLERLIGAEIYNADDIHPEWQHLDVGDDVLMAPDDRFEGQAKMRVFSIVPERALVLGPPKPEADVDGSWAFALEPKDERSTRLLVRTQGPSPNVPPFFFMFDIIHFMMERKMMLGIKERAERLNDPSAGDDRTRGSLSGWRRRCV